MIALLFQRFVIMMMVLLTIVFNVGTRALGARLPIDVAILILAVSR